MTDTILPIRILMVEDTPSDVQIFAHMLERIGFKHETIHFDKGLPALEYCQTSDKLPNMIVLDLGLPDENGLEILKMMRAVPALAEIPIIVYTSSSQKEDLLKTYKQGGTFFMSKLYDTKILSEVLTHLRVTGRLKPGPL